MLQYQRIKKNKYFLKIALSISFLIFFFSCIGENGNPLELVGNWNYLENNDTFTISFNNNGTYTLTDTYGNISIDYSGKYYGDPTTTPKVISFNQTSISINSVSQANADKTFSGTFYIEYISPNKLILNVQNMVGGNGVYTKDP